MYNTVKYCITHHLTKSKISFLWYYYTKLAPTALPLLNILYCDSQPTLPCDITPQITNVLLQFVQTYFRYGYIYEFDIQSLFPSNTGNCACQRHSLLPVHTNNTRDTRGKKSVLITYVSIAIERQICYNNHGGSKY